MRLRSNIFGTTIYFLRKQKILILNITPSRTVLHRYVSKLNSLDRSTCRNPLSSCKHETCARTKRPSKLYLNFLLSSFKIELTDQSAGKIHIKDDAYCSGSEKYSFFFRTLIVSWECVFHCFNFGREIFTETSFLGWGETKSTWYVRHYLSYCTNPGW
jgi:hypothetical protein